MIVKLLILIATTFVVLPRQIFAVSTEELIFKDGDSFTLDCLGIYSWKGCKWNFDGNDLSCSKVWDKNTTTCKIMKDDSVSWVDNRSDNTTCSIRIQNATGSHTGKWTCLKMVDLHKPSHGTEECVKDLFILPRGTLKLDVKGSSTDNIRYLHCSASVHPNLDLFVTGHVGSTPELLSNDTELPTLRGWFQNGRLDVTFESDMTLRQNPMESYFKCRVNQTFRNGTPAFNPTIVVSDPISYKGVYSYPEGQPQNNSLTFKANTTDSCVGCVCLNLKEPDVVIYKQSNLSETQAPNVTVVLKITEKTPTNWSWFELQVRNQYGTETYTFETIEPKTAEDTTRKPNWTTCEEYLNSSPTPPRWIGVIMLFGFLIAKLRS